MQSIWNTGDCLLMSCFNLLKLVREYHRPIDNVFVKSSWSMSNFLNFVLCIVRSRCKIEIGLNSYMYDTTKFCCTHWVMFFYHLCLFQFAICLTTRHVYGFKFQSYSLKVKLHVDCRWLFCDRYMYSTPV